MPFAACGILFGDRVCLDERKRDSSVMAWFRGFCGGDDLPVNYVYQATFGGGFLCGNSGLPDCGRYCVSGQIFYNEEDLKALISLEL